MKKRTAFSLLELSIVTIIIGILITGVMAGAGMIRNSKVANARLFTSKSVVPEISGLIAWYESSSLDSFLGSQTTEGTQVTAWYDLTPGSNSGIYLSTKKNSLIDSGFNGSNSSVTYAVDGINGTPSVRFKGIHARLALTSFYQGTSSQHTIFIVFRPTISPSSTTQIILDSGIASNPTSSIGIKDTAIVLDAGTPASITTPFNVSTDYILATYLNDSVSQVFVNEATTAAGSGLVAIGDNQLSGITIGTTNNGNSGFEGLISEIIVFNRPLKIQERKDIMGYLSKKYKISVTGL